MSKLKKFSHFISGLLIGLSLLFCFKPEPTFVEVVVSSPPKIHVVEKIKIQKHLIVDSVRVSNMADSIANDIVNDYFSYVYSNDFKPDSTFQGAKVDCYSAFRIENNEPIPIPGENKIRLEPYPAKQIECRKEYKPYPWLGKISWMLTGSVITYGVTRYVK